MSKIELKHLAPYLPHGLKVQFEGILNGKELSEYDKRHEKACENDIFANWTEIRPIEVKGLKIGKIRKVQICENFTKYYIGGRGTQTHYGAEKFKPILYPLSCLTKEIEVNGEKIIPIEYISTSIKDSQLTMKRVVNNQSLDALEYWKIERLLSLRFDVFGLIEKGLAIEITEEFNPYK